MTEFSRKGHWRSLPDGTRTWVSGHEVIREPAVVSHGYDDAVIKRRLALALEKRAKAKAAKAAKKAASARQKAARQKRKVAASQQTEK